MCFWICQQECRADSYGKKSSLKKKKRKGSVLASPSVSVCGCLISELVTPVSRDRFLTDKQAVSQHHVCFDSIKEHYQSDHGKCSLAGGRRASVPWEKPAHLSKCR